MSRLRVRIATLLLCALLSGATPSLAAYGSFCFAPRAPSFFMSKPSKPICYNGCSQLEVDSYKNSVRSYFSSLETYADEVDRHHKKQIEYIERLADLS